MQAFANNVARCKNLTNTMQAKETHLGCVNIKLGTHEGKPE